MDVSGRHPAFVIIALMNGGTDRARRREMLFPPFTCSPTPDKRPHRTPSPVDAKMNPRDTKSSVTESPARLPVMSVHVEPSFVERETPLSSPAERQERSTPTYTPEVGLAGSSIEISLQHPPLFLERSRKFKPYPTSGIYPLLFSNGASHVPPDDMPVL